MLIRMFGISCLVYQVDRSDINHTKNYNVTFEKHFKECCINHTASFRNKSKGEGTELSEYIWEMRNSSMSYDLKIIHKSQTSGRETGGSAKGGVKLFQP